MWEVRGQKQWVGTPAARGKQGGVQGGPRASEDRGQQRPAWLVSSFVIYHTKAKETTMALP